MRNIVDFCIEQCEIDFNSIEGLLDCNIDRKNMGILIGKCAGYINILKQIVENQKELEE